MLKITAILLLVVMIAALPSSALSGEVDKPGGIEGVKNRIVLIRHGEKGYQPGQTPPGRGGGPGRHSDGTGSGSGRGNGRGRGRGGGSPRGPPRGPPEGPPGGPPRPPPGGPGDGPEKFPSGLNDDGRKRAQYLRQVCVAERCRADH